MFSGWKITNVLDVGLCELDTADGPYNKTGYRLEHREDGFAITVGLMEYISGWSALEILYWLHENKRYQGDTTMREGNEDNKPRLCVPTLDGNAHVIPMEVFDKIISGEMKITDMDDWEIITRTAFSEWLRGLETAAKTRVYKAAVDHIADTMAAGAWQDGPAPKDGSWILGLFHGLPYVVGYDSWEVGGEMLPDGTGSPPDGHESGWCLAGDNIQVMDQDEPEKWARIIHPDRHMPASWERARRPRLGNVHLGNDKKGAKMKVNSKWQPGRGLSESREKSGILWPVHLGTNGDFPFRNFRRIAGTKQ